MTDTHFHTHPETQGSPRGSHAFRFLAAMIAFLFAFSGPIAAYCADTETSDAPANLSPKAHKASGENKTPKKSPATEAKDSDDYPTLRVGPGDVLNIQVYGESGMVGGGSSGGVMNQLPTEYQVDSEGLIVFPFLGRVNLAGLSPAEASEKIARLLSKPRKVTVLIRQSNTFWVSVLGDVSHPGKYQILGKPTLLSALAEAGGPMTDADMGGAILIHNSVKNKVNLDKYLTDEGVQESDPYLYPGDTLMVKKSGWPSTSEWAIIASILASGAVITVELINLKH